MNFLWLAAFVCVCTAQDECGSQVRVFSDVDDTLLMGGFLPFPGSTLDRAWSPNWFRDSVPYPGMAQFEKELMVGPNNDGVISGIMITTARPDIPLIGDTALNPFQIDEDSTVGQLLNEVDVPLGEILYGSLSNFATIPPSHVEFGEEKVDDITEFIEDNPGSSFFFVGDNGQGDVYAADTLLNQGTECFQGAYMHDVLGSPLIWPTYQTDIDEDFTPHENVWMYRNAAHAAMLAYENGHISKEGVQRIIDSIKGSEQWGMCSSPCVCSDCDDEALTLALAVILTTTEAFFEFIGVDNVASLISAAQDAVTGEQSCFCEDCQGYPQTDDVPPACEEIMADVAAVEALLSPPRPKTRYILNFNNNADCGCK